MDSKLQLNPHRSTGVSLIGFEAVSNAFLLFSSILTSSLTQESLITNSGGNQVTESSLPTFFALCFSSWMFLANGSQQIGALPPPTDQECSCYVIKLHYNVQENKHTTKVSMPQSEVKQYLQVLSFWIWTFPALLVHLSYQSTCLTHPAVMDNAAPPVKVTSRPWHIGSKCELTWLIQSCSNRQVFLTFV